MKIIINESQLKKLITVIISEKDNSKIKGLDEKSRSFAFTRKKTLFSKNAMMSNPDRFKKYDKEIKDIVNELFDTKSTFKRNVYGDDEKYRAMTKEKVIIWDSENKVSFQYIFDSRELNGYTFVHLYPYFENRDDSNLWNYSLSDSKKSKIFIDAIKKLPDVLKEYMKKFGDIDKIVFRGRTRQMGRIYSSTSFINFLKSNFESKYNIKIIEEKDGNFEINTVIMELRTTIREYLNEAVEDYSKWKRKNVTLRGIKEMGKPNDVYGSFGKGLYTVPLSNKSMAKQYGDLYFVVNGRPKNPKIVDSLNNAEIFRYKLMDDFCKKHNKDYSLRFFEENTTMEDEMLILGYDGLIIKGREMVNYSPENIKYFKTENQLHHYYETLL